MTQPKLAPPGAGLPFIEGLVLRHWIFPRHMKEKTWRDHFAQFMEETDRIIAAAARLADEKFFTPVLIKRPRGLEDSSRHWSVAMAVEHLIIVNDGATRIAAELAKGRIPKTVVDTARVKPANAFQSVGRAALLDAFAKKSGEAVKYLEPLEAQAKEEPRLPHPWLGPLSAGGWIGLMALHQSLHRAQVEAIVGD